MQACGRAGICEGGANGLDVGGYWYLYLLSLEAGMSLCNIMYLEHLF